MGNAISCFRRKPLQPNSVTDGQPERKPGPTSATVQPKSVEEQPKTNPELSVGTPTLVNLQSDPALEKPNTAPHALTAAQPSPTAEPESRAEPTSTPPITDHLGASHSLLQLGAQTTLNAFKLSLGILSDVSEFVPVAGLKPAIEGVLECLEKVQQTAENAEILQELNERIKRVNKILDPLRDKKYLIDALSPVVADLTKELESLANDIKEASSHGKIVRFFNSADDASSLARHNANLDDIIASFSLTLIMKHTLDERGEQIRGWLNPPDPYTNYSAARLNYQPYTGAWFLGSKQFSDWKETADGFVWIYGMPGCGKTFLCSSIIADIQLHCIEDISCGLAYFFFDSRDAQEPRQVHRRLLCSLIWQFAIQCGTIPPVLDNLYGDGNHSQLPSTDSLQRVLKSILTDHFKHSYIILDALDECKYPTDVLDWITEICGWKMQNLHLLVTSRETEEFHKHLNPLEPKHVPMDVQMIKLDIQLYLEAEIPKTNLRSLSNFKEVQQLIISTLVDRSEGIFRLVVLQLKELEDGSCATLKEVKEQLEALPTELYGAYTAILSKISKKHKKAIQFLQWLAFSKRPLQSTEIGHVAGVDVDAQGGPSFDQNDVYSADHILQLLPGLVGISEGIMKLAHYSVKEYLLSDSTPENFRINEAVAHSVIAQTCLAYLLQFKTEPVTESTLEQCSLAMYAAEYWIEHTHAAGADHSDTLQGLIQRLLLSDSPQFLSWVRLHNIDDTFSSVDLKASYVRAPPLYYAALAGLEQTSQMLLHTGADVNRQGGKYGTALGAASLEGHKSIVQLLLDNGADVNAPGGPYGTVLGTATFRASADIVQLLLDKGADVNVEGGIHGTVLEAASYRGSKEIVQMLLDKGADVNAEGGEYGSPLGAASYGGEKEVMQLLLDKGADIDAQISLYGTPLAAAVINGNKDIVQFLLDKGANINAPGGLYGPPLIAASDRGSKEMVQLLLNNGADVSIEGGNYKSALGAASNKGSQDVVQLLLDNGADVNAEGGYYGSALTLASYEGFKDVVQLLLERGANINAQSQEHGSVLAAASARGHKDIVQLLLDKGANVNIQGGKNALTAALYAGQQDIAQLLIDNGADGNMGAEGYDTALAAASYLGAKNTVQLLLDKGADVNVQGGYYGTALIAAADKGDKDIVQLLLDHGADVNGQGGSYGTALEAASYRGWTDIVQLLLDKGADVNAQEGYYGTALIAALDQSNKEIVEILLKHGADVNVEGDRYCSALQAASYQCSMDLVQLLLDHGADVNIQGAEEGTALGAASCQGSKDIVQLLLDKGADVNIPGEFYGSALGAASHGGWKDIVELLLDHGADINAQGGRFGSALGAASYEGRRDVVQLLLEKGADVNAKGGDSGTALMQASLGSHEDIVQLLHNSGAIALQLGQHSSETSTSDETNPE